MDYKSVDDFIIKEACNDLVFEFDDAKFNDNLNDAYGQFKDENLREVKLIIACILYIGMIINTEQLLKQCENEEDRIYCNSLIKFYTGSIVVIPNVSVYGINEVVDLKLLEKVVKWEASYNSRFEELDIIPSIVSKTADLITAYKRKECDTTN